ncbi:L,D-transpeptidase [Rhizobium lusitanum]|uniref:Lipoprotein-anchoring transpeptidase ErfK/SrfK n=1 Tax=Rhizobium lusitanum TaxID=293958 RepID=A0A7X0MDP4_9HYPH|nr:L,D-transpeptidase [Rhizobium lusitanum]MBB6486819.1 lipoprotein-anchoring transpeptidase ErfK/SrfK [Rhizobium lusitanum]
MQDVDIIIRRRTLLVAAVAGLLAGCSTTTPPIQTVSLIAPASHDPLPTALAIYAAMPQEEFPIPAVDLGQVEPRFRRQVVDYPTNETVGTLIVDTPNKFLYHVLPGGKAMRYGVGVGRDGFSWSGRATVAYKRAWPNWTPPDEMVARDPRLRPVSKENGGMPPGLRNPLGARALYIHQGGKDTLYRLHGTPEAFSIGKAVSSGCIRLLNQDVIGLYNNVRDGSTIVVLPDPSMREQPSA